MRMAAAIGIDTPLHGLIRTRDNQFCYFIRRFDRIRKSGKLAVEDFGQLLGLDRETKYESSMERIASTLQELSSFPVIQSEDLFKRVLLMYLTGNEDCHVKNFSILTTEDGVHQLSPVYDMVNTTIVLDTNEELALPLNGKKSRLTREDFVTYFAAERLQLPETIIHQILSDFARIQPVWDDLLTHSFLSDKMKQRYTEVLDQRREILNL